MLGSSLASCRHDVRSPKLDRKVAPWSGFDFFFCFIICFRSFCFCYYVVVSVFFIIIFSFVVLFAMFFSLIVVIIEFYLLICFRTCLSVFKFLLTLLNLVFSFHVCVFILVHHVFMFTFIV